jgi:hypothetical protein
MRYLTSSFRLHLFGTQVDLDEGFVTERQRHVQKLAMSAKPLPAHLQGDDALARQQCNVVLETLIGATEKRFEFYLKGVDSLISAADAAKDVVMDGLDAFVVEEVAGASSNHGVTGLGRRHHDPDHDAPPPAAAAAAATTHAGGAAEAFAHGAAAAPGQIKAAIDTINEDMAERGEVIKVPRLRSLRILHVTCL